MKPSCDVSFRAVAGMVGIADSSASTRVRRANWLSEYRFVCRVIDVPSS